MNEIKSVITINKYGKIKLCLNEIMEEKNITINYLAKSVNTSFEVIKKWCGNNVEKLSLDLLARICYVLDCSPEDIIKYDSKNER